MFTKPLVLTDNAFLAGKFFLLAKELCDASIRFTYAYSAAHPAITISAEDAPDLLALDVRSDAEYIRANHDLLISLHCKQIFPPELVRAIRCINVHPGYNPYNRGWFPQVFSILNGLPLGATIHEIDQELDHGRIIDRKRVLIDSWDTSLTAYNKVLEAELDLLRENLADIILDRYASIAPEEEGNVNLKKSFTNLLEIDRNEYGSFGSFIDRLRALTHEPYKNAFFRDGNGQKVFVKIQLEKERESNL